MVYKPALIRAFRTFLQGCAGVLAMFALWLGKQSVLDWEQVRVEGNKVVLGLLVATSVAVVSFIHNLIELNTSLGEKTPRG